ncbi:hypothetical protein M419DRAFT_122715 [Trichoderma reesei RUT C-30]|jgi:hypothetical protein|uniref:Uncharacterized protein n=1 Tax=Hypocrea jecorina (strain ATCC 56765 / BCRC 32924 / NRRL 11460 / Rut C-30) TaxID=1344414 RepID=A0A024SGW8_HYPJR|nr:hypothetical protein M419DRAFT_122715 [Trichoderma reesei RUT C-30]
MRRVGGSEIQLYYPGLGAEKRASVCAQIERVRLFFGLSCGPLSRVSEAERPGGSDAVLI